MWEADDLPSGGAIKREQIEEALANEEGAYRRLRRAMDAWTALWFWPLTETSATVNGEVISPPTTAEWVSALQGLLGRNPDLRKRTAPGQNLISSMGWDELNQAEQIEIGFAGAKKLEMILTEHPWLVVCERIAQRQGFFHWNLDFATVFAKGGFDLQVGNPPWVRPTLNTDALLAEGDPWWQLANKPTQAQIVAKRAGTLELPGMAELVALGTVEVLATAAFVGAVAQYPYLRGLQPDLYRCFMGVMWRHGSARGTMGMIHLNSHFTDEKAGVLRSELYSRLRRHWHFVNELMLFEIEHHKHYGITVHGPRHDVPRFIQASWLYHPDTVVRSLVHDGSGPEPGLKDDEGRWDTRPHQARITEVTDETLRAWHATMETADVPILETRMVYAVNRSSAVVLEKLAMAPRIGALDLRFSAGWHEKNDRTKGFFEWQWGTPKSWDDVILQGPHIFVSTPFYKVPNESLLNNQDWSATDFETLRPQAIPATAFSPTGDRSSYDRSYTDWGDSSSPDRARDHYRISWRYMVANQGERTLIPAVIPPGAAHTHGLMSASPATGAEDLMTIIAFLSSLTADMAVRVAPKSTARASTINRLPIVTNHALSNHLRLRALRLNAVTDAYSNLWEELYTPEFHLDSWAGGFAHRRRAALGEVDRSWTPETPLRVAVDRRQALLEIDVLVALMLGLSPDELCSIYRTQFAVLRGYDQSTYIYDADGRLVPNRVLAIWRHKGRFIDNDERTVTTQSGGVTYELPFTTLDREADMRQAYSFFEQRLREHS